MRFYVGDTDVFQSTPSGGKATSLQDITQRWIGVSIHAFRGEGDRRRSATAGAADCFNPRLPGGRRPPGDRRAAAVRGFNPRLPGGRRLVGAKKELVFEAFQSTPSGGKATQTRSGVILRSGCFNPRLPGGRRHQTRRVQGLHDGFNPRLPGGRRRDVAGWLAAVGIVSIHAFRGEGDSRRAAEGDRADCFNPRLPGGRRPPSPNRAL